MKRFNRFLLLFLIALLMMTPECVLSARERRPMEETEITEEDSYRLGLSTEEFRSLVDRAHLVRPDLSVTGFEVLAVRAADVRAAKKLYRTLLHDYEWAPCDPAERVAFLRHRDGVFRVKGSETEVDAFVRHLKEKGTVNKRILINNN